jgi:hypothetical protein
VIGNLSAAIAFDNRHCAAPQQVACIAARAESENRKMLRQPNLVFRAGSAGGGVAAHRLPRDAVFAQAEIFNPHGGVMRAL